MVQFMDANDIVQELSELHQEELPSPKLKKKKWVVLILIIGVLYVAIFLKLEKSYKVDLIKAETNYKISLSIAEFGTIKEIGTMVIGHEKYLYQIVSVQGKNNSDEVDVYLKLNHLKSDMEMLEGKVIVSSSTIIQSIYQIVRKE